MPVKPTETTLSRPPAPAGETTFIAFGRALAMGLKRSGRIRSSETYRSSLNSLERFLGGADIAFGAFDSALVQEYERYLRRTGVCPNTSSYYMRNLRAIYNRAVDRALTAQRHPFRRVYTGIGKTAKRALSLQTIRRMRELDLTHNPAMEFARDMFLFSFYTRGMSIVDMAFLQHRDLRDGVLTYRRKKTNQQLFIRWERPMQEIVDKYDTSGSLFILPIIREPGRDHRRQYLNAAHLINSKLKKLGTRLETPVPLTSYVARHTWASIARSKNIPLSVISEAMGHTSEAMTRIYLASLDTAVVDKANRVVLESL